MMPPFGHRRIGRRDCHGIYRLLRPLLLNIISIWDMRELEFGTKLTCTHSMRRRNDVYCCMINEYEPDKDKAILITMNGAILRDFRKVPRN